MANYAYIVECSDGTLYTGYTNNLEKRINAHNSGHGAKYTRPRLPVKLVYFEEYSDANDAISREKQIKGYSRSKKNELVKKQNPDFKDFSQLL